MNDLYHIWEIINQYPACVPVYLFGLMMLLMILSFMTGMETNKDIHLDISTFDEILISSGISKVPLVIGLTLTLLPMSIIFLFLQDPIFNTLKEILPSVFNDAIFYTISTIALFIVFIVCLYIGGWLSKPLARFIESNMGHKTDYIGKIGIVHSREVNSEFGEIRVVIDSSEHILKAYSENPIAEDNHVMILEHLKDKEKYFVKAVE